MWWKKCGEKGTPSWCMPVCPYWATIPAVYVKNFTEQKKTWPNMMQMIQDLNSGINYWNWALQKKPY